MPQSFWDRVIPEPNTGCWLWTGRVHKAPIAGGFTFVGKWRPHGKCESVHRSAIRAFGGEVSRGQFANSKCGVDICCNPTHRTVLAAPSPARIAKRKLQFAMMSPAERKSRQQRWLLWQRFGLTVEQFDGMVLAQNGRCKICDEGFGIAPPHIDHSHATGEIRGLLCKRCNLGLGSFRDTPEFLERAAEYLRSPVSVTAVGAAGRRRLRRQA